MRNVIKISVALISVFLLTACQEKPPMYYGTYTISDTAKVDKITVNITVGVGKKTDKKITVVKNGELLVKNITEPNVSMEFIEIINPKKSLYYSDVSDNVYYPMGGDMKVNYMFYDSYVIGKSADIDKHENEFFQGYNDKKP